MVTKESLKKDSKNLKNNHNLIDMYSLMNMYVRSMKNKKIHKCKQCANCCSYFCSGFEAPDCRDDFDDIAWILVHQNVSFHILEDGAWQLMVHNKCRHIGENNQCMIYDKRPEICRDHDPSECDHGIEDGNEYDDVELIIDDLDKLYKYRDLRFPEQPINT